jgi:hypothetical protein
MMLIYTRGEKNTCNANEEVTKSHLAELRRYLKDDQLATREVPAGEL